MAKPVINLIETYKDMIIKSKTTQNEVNQLYNAIIMNYFLGPNLRLNQRAGHKSNGEFIEGLHIYPDEECIDELLRFVQDRLNKDGVVEVALDNPDEVDLGMIRYLSEVVNNAIWDYFGDTRDLSKVDNVFYNRDETNERMAKLSDFRGINCAECIERALATHIILCVLANNGVIKNLFPYQSFIHITNYCGHIDDRNSPYGMHALCGIIPLQQNEKAYLLDITNWGRIKYKNKERNVCGLYELTDDEKNLLLSGGAIAPQLIYARIDGVVQVSHSAFSRNPDKLKKQAETLYRPNLEGR